MTKKLFVLTIGLLSLALPFVASAGENWDYSGFYSTFMTNPTEAKEYMDSNIGGQWSEGYLYAHYMMCAYYIDAGYRDQAVEMAQQAIALQPDVEQLGFDNPFASSETAEFVAQYYCSMIAASLHMPRTGDSVVQTSIWTENPDSNLNFWGGWKAAKPADMTEAETLIWAYIGADSFMHAYYDGTRNKNTLFEILLAGKPAEGSAYTTFWEKFSVKAVQAFESQDYIAHGSTAEFSDKYATDVNPDDFQENFVGFQEFYLWTTNWVKDAVAPAT